MKVLVACEYSGIVRGAFRNKGHDAYSCDILESEDNSPYHIQTDVHNIINDDWDMMIAFPPCTHLAVSGARWFKEKGDKQDEALEFVWFLMSANIDKIAIENPIGVISTKLRKPDQIIQPWMFGHPEAKATCLWLKNLPPLLPTHILQKPDKGYWDNQTPSGQNKLGPSATRWKERSRTYVGIAEAMADQWS